MAILDLSGMGGGERFVGVEIYGIILMKWSIGSIVQKRWVCEMVGWVDRLVKIIEARK